MGVWRWQARGAGARGDGGSEMGLDSGRQELLGLAVNLKYNPGILRISDGHRPGQSAF